MQTHTTETPPPPARRDFRTAAHFTAAALGILDGAGEFLTAAEHRDVLDHVLDDVLVRLANSRADDPSLAAAATAEMHEKLKHAAGRTLVLWQEGKPHVCRAAV